DSLIRKPPRPPGELRGQRDLFTGKRERLRVGKIERRREADREIVGNFVLRERQAVAIGDLPARRRDVENVSARELLRLERRDDRLVFRISGSARRWRRRLRGERRCYREDRQ